MTHPINTLEDIDPFPTTVDFCNLSLMVDCEDHHFPLPILIKVLDSAVEASKGCPSLFLATAIRAPDCASLRH